MVNDLLDLTKIEAGKLKMQKQPFDLPSLLEDSITLTKSMATEKSIQVNPEIQPGLGIIDADKVRLKQILYNLLSNAVKFSESGKRIGLRAYHQDGCAIIEVWDEGRGIDTKDVGEIFHSFQQVESSMSSKPEGTGLGMAIAKRLVEMHGGQIAVESRLGVGSTFRINLPYISR
ncbi:MAG: hypothetical protein DRP87_00545, partial [Spirochaetes bacterium]